MIRWLYRNQTVYEFIMLLLYQQHYASRYRVIAELIPTGATVLDVCCGPAVLYTRFLSDKGVNYIGLDLNNHFATTESKGIKMIRADLAIIPELPAADFVVMQASLYHFLPHSVVSVIGKMLKAAKQNVIIAEPVRNLSSSRLTWLARLAQTLTDCGSGTPISRFDESL